MITFTVPGKPQGKSRARTFYNNKSNKICTITPEQTVNYENWIKVRFVQAKPKGFIPLSGAIYVDIKAMFKKAKSNKMSHAMLKPDIDNICKVVLDSLNGIAYADDKQVIGVTLQKFFSEPEGLEITIQELT